MGDYGLKLWENDALTLISCFRPVLDQKSEKSDIFFPKNGGFDPSLLSALGWVYGSSLRPQYQGVATGLLTAIACHGLAHSPWLPELWIMTYEVCISHDSGMAPT